MTDEVRRFHDQCLVFLAYTVTPIRLTRQGASLAHMRQRLPPAQLDLHNLKEGGVDAVFLSAGSDSAPLANSADLVWATKPPDRLYMRPVWTGAAQIKRVLWSVDALHRLIEENDDLIELALSADDVERIAARGKIAGLLHVTRGAIGDDLNALRTYYRLGVRSMQIAYDDGDPTWVDSCHSPPAAGGLSDFGRDVIAEMNRLGMIVDLAHASDKAHADVIAVSSRPVLNSHSGARALCNVWRNLTDETMRRLAARGGMLGAFFGSGYLDPAFLRQTSARGVRDEKVRRSLELQERFKDDPLGLALAIRDPGPGGAPASATARQVSPISVLLDHMDYCMAIVGEENYCLGSDFGGIDDDGVQGLTDASTLANLTAAMLARDYDKEKARRILGTNLLRFVREVCG